MKDPKKKEVNIESTNNIIILPEVKKYNDDINRLRKELSAILFEHDELKFGWILKLSKEK